MVARKILQTKQPEKKEIWFGEEWEEATTESNKAHNRMLQRSRTRILLKNVIFKEGWKKKRYIERKRRDKYK